MTKQTVCCLVGMPGSGKSTIGRALTEKLQGWVHVETDALVPEDVLEKLRKGVPASKEDICRSMEAFVAAVKQVLCMPESPHVIVSCGMRRLEMRRQFRAAFPDSHFIHLQVNSKERRQRIQQRAQHSVRSTRSLPLTASQTIELEQLACMGWQEFEADEEYTIIHADGCSVEKVLGVVVDLLNSFY